MMANVRSPFLVIFLRSTSRSEPPSKLERKLDTERTVMKPKKNQMMEVQKMKVAYLNELIIGVNIKNEVVLEVEVAEEEEEEEVREEEGELNRVVLLGLFIMGKMYL